MSNLICQTRCIISAIINYSRYEALEKNAYFKPTYYKDIITADNRWIDHRQKENATNETFHLAVTFEISSSPLLRKRFRFYIEFNFSIALLLNVLNYNNSAVLYHIFENLAFQQLKNSWNDSGHFWNGTTPKNGAHRGF